MSITQFNKEMFRPKGFILTEEGRPWAEKFYDLLLLMKKPVMNTEHTIRTVGIMYKFKYFYSVLVYHTICDN